MLIKLSPVLFNALPMRIHVDIAGIFNASCKYIQNNKIIDEKKNPPKLGKQIL